MRTSNGYVAEALYGNQVHSMWISTKNLCLGLHNNTAANCAPVKWSCLGLSSNILSNNRETLLEPVAENNDFCVQCRSTRDSLLLHLIDHRWTVSGVACQSSIHLLTLPVKPVFLILCNKTQEILQELCNEFQGIVKVFIVFCSPSKNPWNYIHAHLYSCKRWHVTWTTDRRHASLSPESDKLLIYLDTIHTLVDMHNCRPCDPRPSMCWAFDICSQGFPHIYVEHILLLVHLNLDHHTVYHEMLDLCC